MSHSNATTRAQLPTGSPSEDLPPGDKHVQRIDFFWPNGMANLTDGGKMRQYRLGYALRRRYSALMADSLTASSQLLAFSSAVQRCVDSARLTLRGFYSLDRSRAAGLRWLQDYNANCFSSGGAGQQLQQHCSGRQLAAGSGSPAEWEKVNIDLHGVPSLDWHYLDDCYWRRTAGRSDIDSDLMLSAAVANLTGILQLKEQLERSYNLTFVYDTINHWSTILTELRLEHTKETVAYTDHFAHWINKKVTLENGSSLLKAHQHRWTKVEEKLPTLFDVYEVLNLYVSRDRIPEGTASRIQLGPMLVSLIDSQQVALAGADRRAQPQLALVNKEYADTYKDRRVLLYFTHDTIIQLLMFRLHLIEEDKRATYAERFVREYEHDMARQFLAGLRMAEFGTSLAFELYEIKRHPRPPPTQAHSGTQTPAANSTAGDPVKSYAFVQAALYYEEEPTLAPVEFKYLKLGSACRHLFKLKFPSVSKDQMEDLFYDKEFTQLAEFSRKLSCPFELFRNVTMQDYAILPSELDALCLPK